MSAYIEMGTAARIGNIGFSFTLPDSAVVMTGDRGTVTGITTTNVSSAGNILIVGNDCHVSDIQGSVSTLAIVEVTGDRAVISNVTSQLGANGCGIRFNGTTGSVVSGLNSRADENGLIVLDSSRWQATDVYVEASDAVGVIIDGSDRGRFEGVVYQAGQHGIRITDSLKNRVEGEVVDAGRDTNNTYDGVFVDGDSDYNRTALTVSYQGSGNQMRYGLNLSVSTINNHVEASILNGSGSTGAYNDAGTGTVATDDHIV